MNLSTKTRTKAHNYFLAKGIPSKKDEAWKYTSLKKLTDQDLTPVDDLEKNALKEIEKFRHPHFHQIFVINGNLYARKSDQKIFSKNLEISKNSATVSGLLRAARKQTGKIRQESLEALNTAYSRNVDITVKSGSYFEKPLQIVFYSKAPGASYPRIRMVLAENSEMNLVEADRKSVV